VDALGGCCCPLEPNIGAGSSARLGVGVEVTVRLGVGVGVEVTVCLGVGVGVEVTARLGVIVGCLGVRVGKTGVRMGSLGVSVGEIGVSVGEIGVSVGEIGLLRRGGLGKSFCSDPIDAKCSVRVISLNTAFE